MAFGIARWTLAAPMALAVTGMPVVASAFDIPKVEITREGAQHEWPFSIDRGELSCFDFGGQRHVFFAEILTPEEQGTFGNMKLPRMVVVTANPMAFFASFEDRELYRAWDTLETLILRLAPYERMGWALCDDAGKAPDTDEL